MYGMSMSEKEETPDLKKTRCKLNLYCIHRLLLDCKQLGQADKDMWTDLKELFQSADYNLSMELRPIEILWGDTKGIDGLIKEMSGIDKETSGKTKPNT